MDSLLTTTIVRLACRESAKQSKNRGDQQKNAEALFPNMDLLEAVQTQAIAAVVKIYASTDCKGDVVDMEGNTALHVAVKTGNILMIRTILLFFERKYTLSTKKNKKGKKPIDLTTSEEIRKSFDIIDGSIILTSSDNGMVNAKAEMDRSINRQCIKAVTERPDRKSSVLLSLDGGGIRGIVLILVLMAMERRLKNPIGQYIDWMAGTSTGAIVLLGLAMDRSLEDCLKMYLRLKSDVFGQTRPYNVKNYETYLKEIFGAGTKMNDLKNHKVMITACITNIAPPKLKMFRNYFPKLEARDLKDFEFDEPSSIYCWKAARASSAAPTYFSSFEGIYSDGGIMANNPTTELMTEFLRFRSIQEYVGEDAPPPVACVISLGTGVCPALSICTKGRTNEFLKFISKTTEQIKHMAMVFIKQLTASDGLPVERAQTWCHSMKVPYFRLSPPLTQKVELDECRDVFIVQLMWDVEVYLSTEASENLDDLAKLLQTLKHENNNSSSR